MRTRVYVDGFNLYYGALKGTQFKWLNLVELARQVLPSEYVVEKLRYFTARVSGFPASGAPGRQQVYINALEPRREIKVHYGNFLSKQVWRPLVNLPVAGRRIEDRPPVTLTRGNHQISGNKVLPVLRRTDETPPRPLSNALVAAFHTMEEKGSDVNLASHLLNDAWNNSFDAAAVISNDTDLITLIQIMNRDQHKPVFLICPREKVASDLKNAANYVRHIRRRHLEDSQFPDTVDTESGTISKPESW